MNEIFENYKQEIQEELNDASIFMKEFHGLDEGM